MKIGVLGGTFNPIHYGHIRTAEMLLEKTQLDRIVFMVSGRPPHKTNEIIENKRNRLEMVRLALEGYANMEVSDLEVKNSRLSYTIDTLDALKKMQPEDEFIFITGADMFITLPEWHRGEELLRNYSFIAVNRDGSFGEKAYKNEMDQLLEQYNANVLVVDIKTPDISASVIRERLEAGESAEGLLPDAVLDYIESNNLYK